MRRALRSRFVLALVVALLLASLKVAAAAVGALTVATSDGGASRTRYTINWTSSDPGGAVSGIDVDVRAGNLYSLEIVPGTVGDQPTDLYDLTLLNMRGIDVLGGQGANLSNSAGSILVFDPPLPFNGGPLTPTIANAGAAKKGSLILIAG